MQTNRIWRNILALVAAGLVGVGLIFAVESLNMVFYPLPDGVNMEDHKAMAAYVETLPIPAFCVVLAAYAIGSFCSAWTAAKLGRSHQLTLGLILGGLFQICGIWTFVEIPTPMWMWIVGFLVFIPPAYAGARVASRSLAISH